MNIYLLASCLGVPVGYFGLFKGPFVIIHVLTIFIKRLLVFHILYSSTTWRLISFSNVIVFAMQVNYKGYIIQAFIDGNFGC